jgi:hypothetical protein
MSASVCITQVGLNAYHHTFTEIVQTLAGGFAALGEGCHVRLRFVHDPRDVLEPGLFNVLLGDLAYTADRLSDTHGQTPFVVWQLEPLSRTAGLAAHFPPYVELLRRANWVWDYNANNITTLAEWGIHRAALVPFGFAPGLRTVPQGADKVYDACFFGSLTARRRRILEEVASSGLRVAARENCYGEERDTLLARSRICLNLHAVDGLGILEEARLSFLLANRCFVLSELSDHDPYPGGVAYAKAENIAAACRYWLAQPDERRDAVAQTGHLRLRQRPFLPCLRKALNLARA